jgi:outer membrane protein assembly factor BamB
MRKIFGVISAIVLLVSCGTPQPPSVAGKLEKLWQTGFGSGYKALVFENLLIVPSSQNVFAIDLPSGTVAWKYDAPSGKAWNCIDVRRFSDQILATFECGAGSLMVLLDDHGKEQNQYVNQRVSSKPVVAGPRFWQMQSNYVFGNVRQFNVEPSLPMIAANNENVFIVTGATNILRAYKNDGKYNWYKQLKDLVQEISVVGDVVFVHDAKNLLAFAATDGKFLWGAQCLVTVEPQEFQNGYIFATDKSIVYVDKNGIVQHSIEKDGVLSIDLAPDGFAIVANAKLETYGNDLKKLETIESFDGTHQAVVAPGLIITNGTVGQVAYRLVKP